MHVAVDLNWFLQFIGFSLAAVIGLLYLVRNTACRYFLVDSNFDSSPPDYSSDPRNMAAPEFLDSCAVCGLLTKSQCARCKMVKYCSEACQSSHWSEHKRECKDLASSYKANHANSKSVSMGRRALAVHRGRSSNILTHSNQILFPYEDFVKLFNWDKAGYPPCGLINCGNSCFANVVLQCLAYTRPLVAYLLDKGHRVECHSEDWCFFCEFQTHVERTSQSVRPFSPINILSRLPNIGGNLGYGKQEDAHEFMRFAIDNMQSVCLDKFGGEKAVHPSCQETTLIQHIFGGRLQSQVICTECNNISNQFENMMDLTVEIHGDAESLEQCLDQFTAKEQLHGDNMYKCDGCNAYVMAWKRLLIQRAPNILTIALKRFQSGRFGKLNKKVSFPATLELSSYMSDSDGNDFYKLYAVIVHVDMLNASFFGHYICYVKDFWGSWYRTDDCKVERVELYEVLSQGAYMLMYNRISVRPSCLVPDELLRKEESKKWRIEEINSCEKQPAECSSASGHLKSSVDSKQPSSASGLKLISEEALSSIRVARNEKWGSSGPSFPVVKEIEIHDTAELSTVPKIAVPVNTSLIDKSTKQQDIEDIELSFLSAIEDVNQGSKRNASRGLFTKPDEESRTTENGIFEGKGTCDVPVLVITDSTKSKIGNRSRSSGVIHDTVDKSDPGSSANLRPIFSPGFLWKKPQNILTDLAQNVHLNSQTNGIERESISQPNLPVFMDVDLQEGKELSAAPEEVSSISYASRPVHTKTSLIGRTDMQPVVENRGKSSLCAAEFAGRGNERDPDGTPARIGGESYADVNCTIEENESTCNNVLSQVITAGQVRDEANNVNSSNVTRNVKSTANRLDLESSAAKLKPIFTPGFLVKNTHKRIVKSGDEVAAKFSELTPDNPLNNKINEVGNPCLLRENGGLVKEAEKPHLVHANGKAFVDSYICPSVENRDSSIHNLDLR